MLDAARGHLVVAHEPREDRQARRRRPRSRSPGGGRPSPARTGRSSRRASRPRPGAGTTGTSPTGRRCPARTTSTWRSPFGSEALDRGVERDRRRARAGRAGAELALVGVPVGPDRDVDEWLGLGHHRVGDPVLAAAPEVGVQLLVSAQPADALHVAVGRSSFGVCRDVLVPRGLVVGRRCARRGRRTPGTPSTRPPWPARPRSAVGRIGRPPRRSRIAAATRAPCKEIPHSLIIGSRAARLDRGWSYYFDSVSEEAATPGTAPDWMRSSEALTRAYALAREAHSGQAGKDGRSPYIRHPLAVAERLAAEGLDEPTLVAAILHDVVESSDLGLDEVVARFGTEVGELVSRFDRRRDASRTTRSAATSIAPAWRPPVLGRARSTPPTSSRTCGDMHDLYSERGRGGGGGTAAGLARRPDGPLATRPGDARVHVPRPRAHRGPPRRAGRLRGGAVPAARRRRLSRMIVDCAHYREGRRQHEGAARHRAGGRGGQGRRRVRLARPARAVARGAGRASQKAFGLHELAVEDAEQRAPAPEARGLRRLVLHRAEDRPLRRRE